MPWTSRIGKLLETEFFELKEPILAESPFTEVTAEGIGVRQYHIGLTSSKLFFASDNFEGIDLNNSDLSPTSRVPECETLSLVKMVPLYELRVRFCAKNGRHIMNICSEIEKSNTISLEMGGHFYKTLLSEEYRNIDESVLVECPFTQVTESGMGIRQYQIALTNSKLLFACDDFDAVEIENFRYHVEPPETETLSLVSFMPLQALKMHFYRHNGRQIMRITTINDDRPMLFEIGGHMYQNLLWNTFREQVACLHQQSPSLWHLNGDSPFASTDVLEDDFICEALVHANPSTSSSSRVYIACRGYYSA